MRNARLMAAALTLAAAGIACALPSFPAPGDAGADATEIAASVAATLTAAAPAPSIATDTLAPTVAPTYPPNPARLWMTFMGSGSEAKWLEPPTATTVTLPISIGQFYDFAPSTGKILYASHFANTGAGPGNLAVSDLWIADYPVGTVTSVVPTNTVVEARWAPDGQAMAYILATPATYELHWRTLAGDDRIIATDLAPTWSIAPTGDRVAFTRETGYELTGAPGLYVVSNAGGAEIKVADADRHGSGSIDDTPAWSFDGSRLALSYSAVDVGAFGVVIAAADGSGATSLTFGPSVDADVIAGGMPVGVLWHPDGRHLVGLGGTFEGMGGPQQVVVFELDPGLTQIVSSTSHGLAMAVIDWATPGSSVWVLDDAGHLIVRALD